MADTCECDYEPEHHGVPCNARPMDHGHIRTSPELCGPCLFACKYLMDPS